MTTCVRMVEVVGISNAAKRTVVVLYDGVEYQDVPIHMHTSYGTRRRIILEEAILRDNYNTYIEYEEALFQYYEYAPFQFVFKEGEQYKVWNVGTKNWETDWLEAFKILVLCMFNEIDGKIVAISVFSILQHLIDSEGLLANRNILPIPSPYDTPAAGWPVYRPYMLLQVTSYIGANETSQAILYDVIADKVAEIPNEDYSALIEANFGESLSDYGYFLVDAVKPMLIDGVVTHYAYGTPPYSYGKKFGYDKEGNISGYGVWHSDGSYNPAKYTSLNNSVGIWYPSPFNTASVHETMDAVGPGSGVVMWFSGLQKPFDVTLNLAYLYKVFNPTTGEIMWPYKRASADTNYNIALDGSIVGVNYSGYGYTSVNATENIYENGEYLLTTTISHTADYSPYPAAAIVVLDYVNIYGPFEPVCTFIEDNLWYTGLITWTAGYVYDSSGSPGSMVDSNITSMFTMSIVAKINKLELNSANLTALMREIHGDVVNGKAKTTADHIDVELDFFFVPYNLMEAELELV